MDRLKNEITSADFWKAAGIRALKTFCQTAIAAIGTTALIEQVNWLVQDLEQSTSFSTD